MVNGMAGKGSRYRPVDEKKWEENYRRIFGTKEQRDRAVKRARAAYLKSYKVAPFNGRRKK